MKQHISQLIHTAISHLQKQGILMSDLPFTIQVERTRDPQHGDFACNIAMILAKAAGCKPRDLAEQIVANLPTSPKITQVTIAGPGFINFSLAATALHSIVVDILAAGPNFGCAQIGVGSKVLIEFVSSNPTGPLHVGHGRGAAYGASVSNLLEAIGYAVQREYYVNDAGRQMDILAVSVWLRYLELLGEPIIFPVNGYKGDYVVDIAKQLQQQYAQQFLQAGPAVMQDLPQDAIADGVGDKEAHIDALILRAKNLLGKDAFRQILDLSLQRILADIRDDLAEFGVKYQEWFSERSLVEAGAIEHAIAKLQQAGHLYEQNGAIWFRSTAFGDDKDRVMVRENGQPTYFAADVAYHLNKFERDFSFAINVFGADHHGYIPRLKAALQALSIDPKRLEVLVVQFATLYRGTERVQMSTRSGSFITLRELRNEVGNDAARFFYVLRKCEQHMDFDLELAKSESSDNPVYYIQYAHARICSVMRQLQDKQLQWDKAQGLNALPGLVEPHEKALLAELVRYPETLLVAARHYEPHLLAHYLRDLAHSFHTYYNSHQFLVEDEALRNARLSLIMAVRQVLVNGLSLLGVAAPEIM